MEHYNIVIKQLSIVTELTGKWVCNKINLALKRKIREIRF